MRRFRLGRAGGPVIPGYAFRFLSCLILVLSLIASCTNVWRTGSRTGKRRRGRKSARDLGSDGVELPLFSTDVEYADWGKRLDSLGLERAAVTVRNGEDNPISADGLAHIVASAGLTAGAATIDHFVHRAVHKNTERHFAVFHLQGDSPATTRRACLATLRLVTEKRRALSS